MVRYQIYRKKEVKRNGKWLDIFSSCRGWVPYTSRLYKTRYYVYRKVDFLNLLHDGYFYRICSLDQEEFAL